MEISKIVPVVKGFFSNPTFARINNIAYISNKIIENHSKRKPKLSG